MNSHHFEKAENKMQSEDIIQFTLNAHPTQSVNHANVNEVRRKTFNRDEEDSDIINRKKQFK